MGLVVVALLMALVLGLALVGAWLRQPDPFTVTPIEDLDWVGQSGSEWVANGTRSDDGWLVATMNHDFTRTSIREWRSAGGWQTDPQFDAIASGAGAPIYFAFASTPTAVYTSSHTVVLARESGSWTQSDIWDIRSVLAGATVGPTVYVLGEPAVAFGEKDASFVLWSSADPDTTLPLDLPVRPAGAQLAVIADRSVVVGCDSAATAECELVAYSGRVDRPTWDRAALPATVRVRGLEPTTNPGPAFESLVMAQVMVHDGAFVLLAEASTGGTELWTSRDGLLWTIAQAFPAEPHPTRMVGDDSTVTLITLSGGRLWRWAPNTSGAWHGAPLEGLEPHHPLGLIAGGDQALLIGQVGRTTKGWIYQFGD